jgi:hypothetical protein
MMLHDKPYLPASSSLIRHVILSSLPLQAPGLVRGQSKNSSLRRFLFRLRSRFSFHYAYYKSSFNLLLEILSAKHPVRLGGLPDSLKQLRVDVYPKQVPVQSLPLSGFYFLFAPRSSPSPLAPLQFHVTARSRPVGRRAARMSRLEF